jgi:predicted transport protein
MGDIRIFRIDGSQSEELKGSSVALEKSLQTYMEKNLEQLLGITFLASEYTTGKTHAGRIDSLGIDENGFPVIIEYKRALNENVINQGLYYLDWLLDHKAELELLYLKKIGKRADEFIDWSGPRLLCIAGDFTKYDLHAVSQINRNVELIRYRQFDKSLLLLELVNVTSQVTSQNGDIPPSVIAKKGSTTKTFCESLDNSSTDLKDRYEALKAFSLALGDDVQVKDTKFYAAFRRIKNFTTVELRPQSNQMILYLRLNPDEITLEEGFTRDVRNIGHWGTGDLEIVIRSDADQERAKDLIVKSYEEN